MSTVALLVLIAFGGWLLVGVALSVRAGAREAETVGERRGLGAVVGVVRALPPEWVLVGLAVGAVVVWGAVAG